MATFLRIASLMLIATWLSVPQAGAQTSSFGAWSVECSGVLCSATSRTDAAAVHIARSSGELERDQGEGAVWAVYFDLPALDGKPRVNLKIGDGPVDYLETDYGLKPFGKDATHYLADESVLVTLISRLSAASTLQVSFNERYQIQFGHDGVIWHALPADGLADALDHIDTQQKLPGSLRIADMPRWLKPATEPPPAPELPDAVKQAHFHSGGCNPVRHDKADDVQAFESHRLSDTQSLHLIECNLYAYNSDVRAYIAEVFEDKVERIETVSVPRMAEAGWTASTYIPSGAFDPATERLFGYHKGRGLGDCGGSETWRYTGYQGFILVESRFKECGDAPPDNDAEIPDWPVVYRLGLDDVSVLNRQIAR